MLDAGSKKCFISYSWDSDEHKDWVRELAEDLVHNGTDVALDQWDLGPGQDFTEYMERSVREADFVLLVCTPQFKARANIRRGGAGYETRVVTGELFGNVADKGKFIPLLRIGTEAQSLPSYLLSTVYVDFRDEAEYDGSIEKLLRTIHDSPKHIRPQQGKNPFVVLHKAPINEELAEAHSNYKVALKGQIPDVDQFEILMYWGYRPAAHDDLRQEIMSSKKRLFIAGMALTTIGNVLNDPRVTEALARTITQNPCFERIIVTASDAGSHEWEERGRDELKSKLTTGRKALQRFYSSLDDRVASHIKRPLVDFRCYSNDLIPRHFLLQADDSIYVGSYLCHQQGSYSYLLKLRDFGDGLYSLFADEIDYIREHTIPFLIDAEADA